MTTFDYPVWLRIDHWLNVLFLTLIIRSGIEILSTHPKLYWHDDSKPGTEWARFTRTVMPRDRLYDTLDEEDPAHKISKQHRINGKPPSSTEYKVMAVHNFVDWRLRVGGLVENPVTLDLAALHSLAESETQRVMHNCVQGWTSIGEWTGVHLRYLVDLVRPLPQAKYVCFLTMQDNSTDEPASHGGGQFYEVIDLAFAYKPQTLLAYEMNGTPPPIQHGAPLRLRVETQVGFKMAKWINQIEFVGDFAGIGMGTGGWREDRVYYDKDVEI